ncbi:MAG: hypothetical protein LBL86_02045 [Coriobacteriales bacterium]|jgi:uncharacterized membrane protein YidH (DUF202 family)|nr:hypothetical protein [Coriobacteriales bacterium]
MKEGGKVTTKKRALWRRIMLVSGVASLVVSVPMAVYLVAAPGEVLVDFEYDLGMSESLAALLALVCGFVAFGSPVLFLLALYTCKFYHRMAELTEQQEAATGEQERVALAKAKRSLYVRCLVIALGIVNAFVVLVLVSTALKDIEAGEDPMVGSLVFTCIGATLLQIAVVAFMFPRMAKAYYDPEDGSYQVAAPTEEDLYGRLVGAGKVRRKLDADEAAAGVERGSGRGRKALAVALKALGVLLVVVGVLVAALGAIYVVTVINGGDSLYWQLILIFVLGAYALIVGGCALWARKKTGGDGR